jgi:Flp pilus assembly protein TadG
LDNPSSSQVEFQMLLVRFVQDCKAGVAPLLALGIIPLMASVGAAVDYGRASAARAAMQSALDATALMLSKESQNLSGDQFNATGISYFNSNFVRPEVQNVAINIGSSSGGGGNSLILSATGSVRTAFMSLIGLSAITLSITSGANASADGLGCVLSLDPHASGATNGQGSTTVNLSGCSLYDNSDNTTALVAGGSARISALSVGVVGGISGSENIAATQGIKTGGGPVLDPYAKDSFPSFSSCSQQNYVGKDIETINAGVYCGGMKFNAGANVTLNPGIYYLDGGSFTVNGGATVSGNGVTLVFTKKSSSNWATATINGNATVALTPPKSGSTAGIVVFGDRNIPLGTTFKFNGGASQYLAGAIYVPTGAITFAGGVGASSSCTQIVGNTVSFVGNSSLAIDCSSYNTKPFSPLVIKLTS